MNDEFKKWFAARARNPDRITLEEAFNAGKQSAPSVPEGWLRAIDEALVVAHIDVANASDTYEQAKAKLDNLIGLHVDVATDPAVNGGWKLVPIEPTQEMRDAWDSAPICEDDDAEFRRAYQEMITSAPEARS